MTLARDVFGIVGTVQGTVFHVREVVAEGGFAVVYRAQHEGFRADVALKCLKVPGTLSDEARTSFLEKFREEGELLFRLSAAIPAVVRPLHFGVIESEKSLFVPFMALEWLDGETLDRVVQKRTEQGKPPLGLERSVRLLGPVARALERAHRFPSERGVVSILHRDLKPENVFVAQVGREQQVKILDFGIGKVKSAATQIVGKHSLDGDAFSAFTPAYGAPEQWLPKRFGQTGTWTDVWGWTLTVVEAVIGRCPLDGDAAAIMGAVLDPTARPTPRNLGVATSDDVERVFQRALAVDPRDRYQDVGVFWDDLEKLAGCHTPRIERTQSALDSQPPAEALVPELALPDLSAQKRRERAQAPTVAFVDAPVEPLPPAPAPAPKQDTEFLHRGSNWQQVGEQHVGRAASGLALDGVGITPGAMSSPSRRLAPRPRHTLPPGQAASALMRRFQGPLKLFGTAAVIAIAAWVYFLVTGELVRVGPVGPFWLAGPLAVVALVWCVVALFREPN
ncbi:MAG TPA: serine/threonine-protein kinase [Polyangiaceae bacterium]